MIKTIGLVGFELYLDLWCHRATHRPIVPQNNGKIMTSKVWFTAVYTIVLEKTIFPVVFGT